MEKRRTRRLCSCVNKIFRTFFYYHFIRMLGSRHDFFHLPMGPTLTLFDCQRFGCCWHERLPSAKLMIKLSFLSKSGSLSPRVVNQVWHDLTINLMPCLPLSLNWVHILLVRLPHDLNDELNGNGWHCSPEEIGCPSLLPTVPRIL